MYYYIIPYYIEGKGKGRKKQKEREEQKERRGTKGKEPQRRGKRGTRARDAAYIFARSSLSFCSVCCLHRPHHRQPLTIPPGHTRTESGRGTPARLWVMSSPPPNQQPAAGGDLLPASSSGSSPLPSLPDDRPPAHATTRPPPDQPDSATGCPPSCRLASPARWRG